MNNTFTIILATLLFFINTLSLKSQTIPAYVPSNGLVGWWPFTGNANDLSLSGNHATASGAILTNDRFGNINSAYSFTAGYLSSATTTNIPRGGTMSISVWFNEASNFNIGEFICLGSSSNTFWGAVGGYNAFTVNYGRGCGSTGSSLQNINIPYNQWHHVVFVSTGLAGHADIYYDGVYFGTSTTANTGGLCSTTKLYFGIDIYSNTKYPGKLDDIGIWNRALTACEIKDLYLGTSGSGFTTHPISQTIGISSQVQFTVSSSYTNATYQWQTNTGSGFQNVSNGGQYSGATTATLTVSNTAISNNNQQFRCAITSPSCTTVSNSATLTVINDVGIIEYSKENLFSVYPNPSSDQINLKATVGIIGSVYTIYDYTGKVILEGKIRQENTLIDLRQLAVGMYIFSAGTDKKQTVKVIKE